MNLAWAVARMRGVARATAGGDAGERVLLLEAEADLIAEEDRAACAAIGRLGAAWLWARLAGIRVPTVLTHCNAGALATAGIGTALGVVRALAAGGPRRDPRGRDAAVPAGRAPHGVGASRRTGSHVTLLPDVAAASLIARGRVHAVVVGADRIAANGDVANKVGTYGLALAARAHGVPFVVAAPTTTLDLATPDGAAIPIEERDGAEVVDLPLPGGGTASLAPEGVSALYPAFDVTPAALVDAIVTERGVSEPPHAAGARAAPRVAMTARPAATRPRVRDVLRRDGRRPPRRRGPRPRVPDRLAGGRAPRLRRRRARDRGARAPRRTCRRSSTRRSPTRARRSRTSPPSPRRPGPGLVGALLVGLSEGKGLALGLGVPFVPVHHIEAHALSAFVDRDGAPAAPVPERFARSSSRAATRTSTGSTAGGIERLARTRDDAAGEAFDKVAKMAGPRLSGRTRRGPARAARARRAAVRGAAVQGRLRRLQLLRPQDVRARAPRRDRPRARPGSARRARRSRADDAPQGLCDLMADVEAAIVAQLLDRVDRLVRAGASTVLTVSGGVAANTLVRERLPAWGRARGVDVRVAPKALTGDNAVMIAFAGLRTAAHGAASAKGSPPSRARAGRSRP